MIKNITRFINATLLMTLFILSLSLVKPVLQEGLAQQAPLCTDPINRTTSCGNNGTSFYSDVYSACMTSGVGCCQYQMQGKYCQFRDPYGNTSTRDAGDFGNLVGYTSPGVCSDSGVCIATLIADADGNAEAEDDPLADAGDEPLDDNGNDPFAADAGDNPVAGDDTIDDEAVTP